MQYSVFMTFQKRKPQDYGSNTSLCGCIIESPMQQCWPRQERQLFWLIVLRPAVFSLSAFCVLPASFDLEVNDDIVFFDSSVFMSTNCRF